MRNRAQILSLLNRISLKVGEMNFFINLYNDKIYSNRNGESRFYLQISYLAPCTKTKELKRWTGRKWYLSEFMTDDEIFKTCYAAFESCVRHEIMEGFKIDGIPLFNPHTKYEELLNVSLNEVSRDN